MEKQELGRLLNPAEAAQVLSVSPLTLRLWRRLGKGPAYVRLAGTYRYSAADLQSFISLHTRGGQ